MSRPDVLAYARDCHTDIRGLLEAAYYKKHGHPIPVGALDTDVAHFETKSELPDYMHGFMRRQDVESTNFPPMTRID